jgi:F0F1-type ATP synthase membrane subunit a
LPNSNEKQLSINDLAKESAPSQDNLNWTTIFFVIIAIFVIAIFFVYKRKEKPKNQKTK